MLSNQRQSVIDPTDKTFIQPGYEDLDDSEHVMLADMLDDKEYLQVYTVDDERYIPEDFDGETPYFLQDQNNRYGPFKSVSEAVEFEEQGGRHEPVNGDQYPEDERVTLEEQGFWESLANMDRQPYATL